MPIPTYEQLLFPLLHFLSDGKERSLREAVEHLSDRCKLTEEERERLLPSGNQRYIENRVGWARTYLKKAEMLEYPRRGHMRIMERGKEFLSTNPDSLTVDNLKKYPNWEENWHGGEDGGEKTEESTENKTPEEQLELAHNQLSSGLEDELLEQIKSCTPRFFENLVVELLLKMGYGGSRKDAGEAIGRSGDGGVDGIIKEDRLGLDVIYIQAKRWEASVGRPDVQRFAGALQGNRARKGVLITTSNFSREAKEYVESIDAKIILIDGRKLARLMVEHDIGVSPSVSYVLKKIDIDYFVEE